MTTIIRTLGIIILLTFSQLAFGQTKQEKALEKAMEAIALMDEGELTKSIELLNEAIKLDPKNIAFPYELALAYTYSKDYEKSTTLLKGLLKHKSVFDQVYQLIGVNYSYSGQKSKAVEYFDKGLEKFPNSGILHLERGNMDYFEGKYNSALDYYENGIKVDPGFPSNYYWASKIYCNSNEEVWGLIYGEIFMNLERNSHRTAEISKLLFDTYFNEIEFTSETTTSVSFCRQIIMDISSISDTNTPRLPFCIIYEPTLLLSIISESKINITSLDRIRTRFIENYYTMGHSKTHPNILFEYNKRILDAGHFETYNHWILMKGDEEGFENWYLLNEDKWDAFVDWFTENPLMIDQKNKFHRDQY